METDDLSDGSETTKSSHRWTNEVESEELDESEALSDVEETLTATTVFVMGKVGTDMFEMQLLKWIGVHQKLTTLLTRR